MVVSVGVVLVVVTLINTKAKGKSDSCKREVSRSRSSAVLLINMAFNLWSSFVEITWD